MKQLQHAILLAALLMVVGALVGCASGKSGENDEGDVADMEEPDMGDTVGDIEPDAPDSDMETPPAPQGPTRAALSGGGGPRASQQFQLQITVGSPVSSSRLASERYQVEVGVGPFVARPDSQ